MPPRRLCAFLCALAFSFPACLGPVRGEPGVFDAEPLLCIYREVRNLRRTTEVSLSALKQHVLFDQPLPPVGTFPWQAVLDSAGEGIWGVDLSGTCTFVNRAALGMLGFEAAELVGRHMHDMVHHHYPDGRPYPNSECSVYNVFQRNQPFTNQIDHVFRKDGTFFWAEMSAQPIVHEGEVRGAVVTFRDITQSRMAEEALRRSEKLAAVGQLASSIAHEINNPLEAVLNLVYLVRNADSLEEARTYASLAESELARVADITLQTLRFHRQQTSAAPVNLADTISAILRLYASRFPARHITVRERFREAPQALLLEGDIRQVLNNLVRNAYDAMPKGGVLHVRVTPSTCRKSGVPGARIAVADTGTGFLPTMRGHLFEPFHTTKDVTGTGLGLWISKGIIDKHGGRVQMRSVEGKGTAFSIWLPLVPPPPPERRVSERPIVAEQSLSRIRLSA